MLTTKKREVMKIFIVIPCYNEEAVLPKTLEVLGNLIKNIKVKTDADPERKEACRTDFRRFCEIYDEPEKVVDRHASSTESTVAECAEERSSKGRLRSNLAAENRRSRLEGSRRPCEAAATPTTIQGLKLIFR